MIMTAQNYPRETARLYADAAIKVAKMDNIDEETFIKLVKNSEYYFIFTCFYY